MNLFARMGRLGAGRGDLGAAAVIMAAAAILILPVPPALMDLLLSFNMAFAVTLLLVAVRGGGVLKAGAFPTLLLVSTLVRLALNVSTTRLILGSGDAGAVVRSFGAFVTAGNPLVGGVLFAILTIVQFIVIAKGAERVAEVTARFTLDAMPGKQMSIDADLRAGAIDQAQAVKRRGRLEREAQFHGAMDGAMKFVKGDAIASMVITAVNLLGGLLVGCLQRDLSAAEAVERYTLLTIGDGLVSQIPALLISVAAGLVVTSPAGDQGQPGLGRQVTAQLGEHPETLICSGAVLLLLGLAPGMPLLAFSALGLPAMACGLHLIRLRRRRAADPGPVSAPAARLSMRLAVDAACPPDLVEAARSRLGALRAELGVPLPEVELERGEAAGRWTLWLDSLPVGSGQLAAGAGQLPEGLEVALRRSAVHFVGVQETQDLLDALEASQPALVREVVPRLIPPVMLSEILARLVEEQVPVGNLRGILACLAEWARTEADPLALCERVRQRLSALITRRLAPAGSIAALLLDPEVERCLLAALQNAGDGASLALEPDQAQAMLAGLARCLARAGPEPPVVLCRPELRRSFYKVAATSHPLVPVISYLELEPDVMVRPIGRIVMLAQGGAG